MPRQPDLFAPVMHPPVAPAGRAGPRLWVRRLAIFENPQTILRNVPLKPGLNIIWSPDMSNSGKRSLAHGSGKTTFCRLLRGCLGETGYATDAQRSRNMARLPDGLIAAEILVDGACWVAVRPLGLPGDEFVVQANSIEEAIARGRRDGDQAFIDPILIEAFFSTISRTAPPDVGPEQVWDVFRAWLTRDQECRLADVLAWRSPRTQTRSRAQTLGETAKLTMVRLALRALDTEEQAAAARERELEAAAEADRRRRSYNEQRYADSLRTVRAALGVGDDVGFDDTLDQKGLLSLAQAALADAMRADLPKPPDVGSLFARWNALIDERRMLEDRQRKHEGDAQSKRDAAGRYRSEADLGEIDITQGRVRICSICKVRVDEVLARGCGISLERCDLSAIRAEVAEKRRKAAQLTAEADEADREAKRVNALVKQLDPRQQTVAAEVKSADVASHAAHKAATEIQDRIYQARRRLDDVRSLHETEMAVRAIPAATAELDAVRAQLDAGRSRARKAIGTLEDRYKGIMAAWLPDGVEGAIKLDGHGLKVDAQFSGRGEVSTAALDSLKIVALDLAAMHLAIEERADLPAFLMHDSPREADLDGQLYARLFSLVHQWEKGAVTPCFQYIVTTTTAPPPELQNDNYVRLRMSSTPAEERLFGMDL